MNVPELHLTPSTGYLDDESEVAITDWCQGCGGPGEVAYYARSEAGYPVPLVQVHPFADSE